jgi:hypothetical protein
MLFCKVFTEVRMSIEQLHAQAQYFEAIGSWHMAEIIRGWIARKVSRLAPLATSTASAIMDRKIA